jgi:sulfonate transport system substrate-binding protein
MKFFSKLTLLSILILPLQSMLSAAEKPDVIRFGIAAIGTGNRPVFGGAGVATVHLKGQLEEEFRTDGIKIDWSFFKGAGPAVNEALANNLLDFAWQGDLPSIIGKAGGLKTKLLLANGTRGQTYLAVPVDSKIQSLEDIKGKKVAIFKGTNLSLSVAKILEQKGLSEKDFHAINLDGAAGKAALSTKDVDALFGGYDLLQLVDQGIARIVFSTKGQPSSLTRQTHILTTEDFEQKYPAIVQRVVNVLVKESAWISDEKNREEVLQYWAKSGNPYSSWKRDYEGSSIKERSSPLFDEFFVNHYKKAVEASLKFKFIRKPFDVNQWIDPTYVNQAVSNLKLSGYWPEYDADGNPKKAQSAAGLGKT